MKFELNSFKDLYYHLYMQFFMYENFYIVTSYKVASSTLHRIKNLQKVDVYDDSYKTYALVRNPYKRIESLYKDKVLGMKFKMDQSCQEEIFKFYKKTENISFKSFVEDFLPVSLYKEMHFFPQNVCIPYFLKNVTILKMETDMPFIFKITNSKTIHNNKTENLNLFWDDNMLCVINKLYKLDFVRYNYDIKYNHL